MKIEESNYKCKYTSVINRKGFTLLELLLVVVILSAIAFSTVSFFNSEDEQFRYEDTRTRLINIRRAVIGNSEPTFQGQQLLSGYAVENGVLPSTIDELIKKPALYDDFGLQSPLFDPQPGSDGFNNGGELSITWNNNEKLFKGYSSGAYLALPPGSEDKYRDGWGNVGSVSGTSIDCPSFSGEGSDLGSDKEDDNHGWCVTLDTTGGTSTANELYIDSYGSDGELGEVAGNDFTFDVLQSIKSGDWTQDVQGWTVKITNQSGSTISNHGVSLLVYGIRTDGTPGWKRLSTNEVSSLNDGDSADLTFLESSLSTISPFVSIGQHLLTVFEDNNNTPHDSAGETPDLTVFIPARRITKRIDFFSHTVLPSTVELIIK